MRWWPKRFVLSCCLIVTGCSYGAVHVDPDGNDDAGADASSAQAGTGADGDGATDAGSDGDASDVPSSGMDAGEDSGEDSGPVEDAGDPLRVEPYFSSAADWGQYVELGTTTPCAASDLGECEHAGAWRKVVLKDESSCTGISANDDALWLEWTCSVVDSQVVLAAKELHAGVRLLDLIDIDTHRFKQSFVSVTRDSKLLARTETAPFWSNPVRTIARHDTAGEDVLDEAGAVYVITQAQIHDLRITADGVSLVSIVKNVSSVPSSRPVVSAQGRGGLWLQSLDFDLSGHSRGIEVQGIHERVDDLATHRAAVESGTGSDVTLSLEQSVLSKLSITKPAHDGLELQGGHVTLDGASVSQAGSDCMHLQNNYGELHDLRCIGAQAQGIAIFDSDSSFFRGLRVARTSGTGVAALDADDCRFFDVVITAAGEGFSLGSSAGSDPSQSDLLQDVVATNNAQNGLEIAGPNHRLFGITAAGNGAAGLRVEGKNVVVAHTTLAQNVAEGLRVAGGATGGTFIDTLAVDDGTGVAIDAGASSHRFLDIYASDSTLDLSNAGESNTFLGTVTLTSTSSCDSASGLAAPGFSEAPCASAGASSATFAPGASSANAFVGVVNEPDPINSQADGAAHDASAITQWVDFSSRWRVWGLPGTNGDAAARGPCVTSHCVMRDLRMSSASPLADILGANPEVTLSAAGHVLTHVWYAPFQADCTGLFFAVWNSGSSTCTSTFIDYASDGPFIDGSDNGLCEEGEECGVARNHGAYAGEGESQLLSPASGTLVSGWSAPNAFLALPELPN